jgi:hypothetical protein
MKHILLFQLLLFSAFSFAEPVSWFGPEQNEWTQTEYRKVKNDFGAWLLVTPDVDWQQKWNTSPNTVPVFNTADKVRVGEGLVILTFFVNPKTDANNKANVLCDIKTTRADGSVAFEYKDFACLVGNLEGEANYIRLSPAIINFVGEQKDPKGVWLVEVGLHDVNRDTKISLKTQFELVTNG